MPGMKLSPKMSDADARQAIVNKLKDKTLSLADQRRLRDQYKEYYAKGGDVVAKAPTKKQQAKVGKVMAEYKDKSLHSGKGGKVVTNPKQAIAIALSEAGVKPKKKK